MLILSIIRKKNGIEDFRNILSLSEYLWMTHTEDDNKFLGKINRDIKPFSDFLKLLSDYVANCNKNTKINYSLFKNRTKSIF